MSTIPHTREGNGAIGELYNNEIGINTDIDIGCLSFNDFREYLYKKIMIKSMCKTCTVKTNTQIEKLIEIELKDSRILTIEMHKRVKKHGWDYIVNNTNIQYKKDLILYLDKYLGYKNI